MVTPVSSVRSEGQPIESSQLEQTLRALTKDATVKHVTVMAHSMGTWLAMESLRQIAIRDGHVPAKIHNVILASPDLDVDVFARQWTERGSPKPKFTIIVSPDDKALAASRLISGGVERVGQIDPTKEPYKSKLDAAGIQVVDLTSAKTKDGLNHSKFAESPEIVQLIGSQLEKGQTLSGSQVTFAEDMGAVVAGTVNTAGKIAVGTVTAPIAVIEGGLSAKQSDELGAILQGKPGDTE